MLAKMMLIDMHGAFSGQVLSNINIKGLASESYANIVLNRNQAVGEVNYAILNAKSVSLVEDCTSFNNSICHWWYWRGNGFRGRSNFLIEFKFVNENITKNECFYFNFIPYLYVK